ncbi:MAG: hypothetical protein AAGA72_07060 [Pseudomonadota bacterium]
MSAKLDLQRISTPSSFEEVLEYFHRTDAALWSAAQSLELEAATDALIEEIFETRESVAHAISTWEPESLIELAQNLSLWVLQRYPDKTCPPENEWDQVILNAYFQLAGLIGIAPVREE